MNKEEWRDIDGYEGLYQVSSFGRVRGIDRIVNNPKYKHTGMTIKSKLLHQYKVNGYLRTQLYKNSGYKNIFVHRLVAKAFIPNEDGKKFVNHLDGNKHNNNYANLEWCTRSENQIHAYKKGLQKPSMKQKEITSLLAKNKTKKIGQYDMKNNFIRYWNSIKDAEENLHVSHGKISYVCKGKRNKTKTIEGYMRWKYE